MTSQPRYGNQDLWLPESFHAEFVENVDHVVHRSNAGAAFSRQVDLWWYALGIGVAEGRRTPLPDRAQLVRFNSAEILEANPWRITHLELLALIEQGKLAATNAATAIRIGNEYAITGCAILTERLRGVVDVQNQLIYFTLSSDLDVEAEVARAVGASDGATSVVSTEEIITNGESKWVEFKQTGRINIRTKQQDPVIEREVVKSIAGFLNAEGGTLLIGVTDSGEVFGIEKDLKTLGRKQNPDGFALWLNGLLDNVIGPVAAAGVKIQFNEFPDGTICRVGVSRRAAPTYVNDKGKAHFYIRLNNATRLLNTAEAVEYLSTRS